MLVKSAKMALDQFLKNSAGMILSMKPSLTKNLKMLFLPAPLLWTFTLGVGGLPRGRIVEIYGPESFR